VRSRHHSDRVEDVLAEKVAVRAARLSPIDAIQYE
jgi:hypothetical protein